MTSVRKICVSHHLIHKDRVIMPDWIASALAPAPKVLDPYQICETNLAIHGVSKFHAADMLANKEKEYEKNYCKESRLLWTVSMSLVLDLLQRMTAFAAVFLMPFVLMAAALALLLLKQE